MSGAARYVRGQSADPENRQKDDFYPTPPEGTEALLSAVSFNGPIWEPACGDGAISRALEAAGITPLFLVTSNVLSVYRDLARQLGRGIVVPISSSSDNLLQALDRGVEEICGDGLSQ